MTSWSPGDRNASHPPVPIFYKDLERLDDEHGLSAPAPAGPMPRDPMIVDWDGPDDPENPLNWPLPKKAATIGVVSAITFLR